MLNEAINIACDACDILRLKKVTQKDLDRIKKYHTAYKLYYRK